MKKKFILPIIAGVGILSFSAFTVLQSNGMSTYTGSPADAADCAGCHSGGATTPGWTMTSNPTMPLSGTTYYYMPNTTYTFTITGSGYSTYGFDFEIINSNTQTNAASVADFGTLGTAPSGESVYAPNSGGWPHGYHDITHTAPKAGAFTVKWTAPASGTGYLYCAFLGTNNNGSTSGDKQALIARTMAQSPTSIATYTDNSKFDLNVFPNPATDNVRLTYNLDERSTVSVKLYSITGQNVYELLNDKRERGAQSESLALPAGIDRGMYIIKLNVNGKEAFKRLMVN